MLPKLGAIRRVVLVAALCSLFAVTIPVRAALGAVATEWKTISYRGVDVSVPDAWPVVDLDEEATRCARTDVNVVYLGRQGRGAICDPVIVGAAENVHLEPWDDVVDPTLEGFNRREVNGEPALVDPNGRTGGRIVVALERPRTIVRVTFGNDEALAEKVAAGIRVSGASPGPGGSGSAPSPSGAPDAPNATTSAFPGFTVAQTQPAPMQRGIFAGDGFDTCANPALEKMQAWLSSPYRAIGIYVGGINHGCKAQTLSADWASSAARMGWSFLPLYVGRQAPCYAGSNTAKIDPALAASQGKAAADDAIAQADKFGLPTGSPLYFDMEAYSGNSSCVQAVHTFLQEWTKRLRARGYVSGVYSSEASGVANLSAAAATPGFVLPDVIWTAHWGESKRIFGHHQTWLPDSLWKNHQRIHQYRGGHVETWGGESINIDNNFLDAPVVRFAAAPRWLSGDLDGSGGTDLVHLCCGDYANTWLTQGNGVFDVTSFRPWPKYGLQLGTFRKLDFSGDGRDDLVHFCCSDLVYSWRSDGDGTYTLTPFRPWPGYNMALGTWQAGDFNGDGRDDFMHLCCKDYAHLWLSDGDGTFTVKVFRPWNGYGLQLGGWVASDVNGDGVDDLVHLCCIDYAHVWLSDGDGTFSVTAFRPWAGYGLQLGRWLASDANGDGKDDLVHLCCSDLAYTWLSSGNGHYSVRSYRPWAGYGLQLGRWLASDANGDGKDDLVHLCCGDFAYRWRSNGDGTYVLSSHRPWAGYNLQAGSWMAGDADADGDGDLFHLCCAGLVYTWISEPSGTYRLVPTPV